MSTERKAKIIGEIVMDKDCDFDALVYDIFACFKKHNAVPGFKIYEQLKTEENDQRNKAITEMIEKAKRKVSKRS